MLAQHANTLFAVVVHCLHTPHSATVPAELPPDAARQTWSLDKKTAGFPNAVFTLL